MKSRTYQILERILKYCGQVEETNKTFGRSFYAFSENFIYRNAVCMCVLQIGELANLLPMDFRKEYPQVPWREWCGVRDIFAHQYEELKVDVTWDTIEHDVPELTKNVEQIMKEMEEKGEDEV